MGYIQEAVKITVLKLWFREDFINFFDLEIYRFIYFYFYLLIMVEHQERKMKKQAELQLYVVFCYLFTQENYQVLGLVPYCSCRKSPLKSLDAK